MRLTLRTLLAYRDGVLSQTDYEDLHRRIQQSPDAGNLLRRINELTSSGSIPSPKLEAAGLSSANVIAEYLDDVLTSSRIAELERLCLEYSEHLCELAHCHQLIAQAMHTHVEVSDELHQKALAIIDPSKRDQIKSQLLTQSRKMSKQIVAEVAEPASIIGSNSAVSPTAGVGSGSSSPVPVNVANPNVNSPQSSSTTPIAVVVPVASVTTSPQQAGLNLEGASLTTEVPEYLLGSRKLRWQLPAAILSLTAILVFLVWQSIGGSLDTIRNLMTADASQVGVKDKNASDETEKDTNKDKAQESGSAKDDSKGESKKDSGNSDPKTLGNNSTEQSAESMADSVATKQAGGDAEPAKTDPQNPSGTNQAAVPDSKTGDSTKGPAPTDAASHNSDAGPAKPDQSADMASPPVAQPSESHKIVWTPADDVEAQSVVLITSPDGSSLAQPGDEVTEGRFLLPPIARTTIQAGSIKMLAVGPIVMVLNVDDKQLKLSSSNCRAIVSAKSDQASFSLQSPCGSYVIEILDKAVWLGIEINHRRVNRGSAVEPDVYAPVMVLVVGVDAPANSPELVRVTSSDNQQVAKINSPGQGLAVVNKSQMENFALQSPPTWYRKRYTRAIDQLGMADFRQALQASNEPLADKLRQLASDNRPEVAALAIQTAMLRGDWQPFAAHMLTNDRMRAHWSSSLDLARQLIAGRPGTQKELLTELQGTLGGDSDRCAELLAGLGAANQTSDGLLGLVKGLDSANSLPIRVMASYELNQLTGEDFSYQPHAPVRATIQQWRSRIVQNKVSVEPVHDPIYERNGK